MPGVFLLNFTLFKNGINLLHMVPSSFLLFLSFLFIPKYSPVWWEAQIPKACWFSAAEIEKAYMEFKFVRYLEQEDWGSSVQRVIVRQGTQVSSSLAVIESAQAPPGPCLQSCSCHGFIGFCKFSSQKVVSSLMPACDYGLQPWARHTWQQLTFIAGKRTQPDGGKSQPIGFCMIRKCWPQMFAVTLWLCISYLLF